MIKTDLMREIGFNDEQIVAIDAYLDEKMQDIKGKDKVIRGGCSFYPRLLCILSNLTPGA